MALSFSETYWANRSARRKLCHVSRRYSDRNTYTFTETLAKQTWTVGRIWWWRRKNDVNYFESHKIPIILCWHVETFAIRWHSRVIKIPLELFIIIIPMYTLMKLLWRYFDRSCMVIWINLLQDHTNPILSPLTTWDICYIAGFPCNRRLFNRRSFYNFSRVNWPVTIQ